jgi:hypothetical protein
LMLRMRLSLRIVSTRFSRVAQAVQVNNHVA